MNEVLVRITLHGLLALVPVTDPAGIQMAGKADGINRMVALAVDASTVPKEADVCVGAHQVLLDVPAAGADCFAAGCHPMSKLHCQCRLKRQEVSLQPDLELPKRTLVVDVKDDLPGDQTAAASLGYIQHLSELGVEIDPHALSGNPQALQARFRFPVESIVACALATRNDSPLPKVHTFGFPGPAGQGTRTKALAQMAMVHAMFPADKPINLVLVGLDDKQQRVLPLLSTKKDCSAAGGCIEIKFSNERPKSLLPGDPCDDGIGHDFAFLFDLGVAPKAWPDRPVPHAQTKARDAAAIENAECVESTKNPDSRPVCAMAMAP